MITGATGFVGFHTARALLDAGHEVSLLVRSRDKMEQLFGSGRIRHFTVGDITDIGKLRKALANCDAVVVLKGCGTVVADPAGRYAICPLGNPGMATAGTGDVLTGVIGALLAQGLDCWDAACAGVVAHARAGDLAAAAIGERGLLASDITRQLPAVLNPEP
jgi:NAD(P)H-hydrate repair Nnr-like enzyme with NAD(P)H-hydrate dehydratase domain